MKLSFGQLILILSTLTTGTDLISQNVSGIIGARHIVGYRADYKFVQGILNTPSEKSSRYLHNFYVERMMNHRFNLGIALVGGNITADLNKMSEWNDPRFLIANIEDRNMPIVDYYGSCQLNHKGMEFYIKIFPGFKSLRNYGWFWKGGLGIMYTNFRFNSDFSVDAKTDNYKTKRFYITNESFYRIRKSYMAFEIGKNTPMILDRLLFTYSISNNIFFQNSNPDKMDMSLREFADMAVGSHLAYRHSFTLNLGLAYAL